MLLDSSLFIFISRSCPDRANSVYIIKYNLQTEREETQIVVSDYSPRQATYRWGGYSGVDMAVDENGLWVLWGSTENNRKLKVAKINVESNHFEKTWSLNTGIGM